MSKGVVSLVVMGCAKNQVEAETMSSRLAREGWTLTGDLSRAEAVVVHTCGFLKAGRREAEATLARIRGVNSRARVVFTGCYAQYLGGRRPRGVETLLGTGDFDRLPEVLDKPGGPGAKMNPARPGGYHDCSLPRPLSRGQKSAYLRISEGCGRACSFCMIPQLRGPLVSRPVKDILREADDLLSRGVGEICLISQDTTSYGNDLAGRPSLESLIRALLRKPRLKWLRVHYAYPAGVGEGLIDLLSKEKRLCGYLDLPLQHISGPVLKAMGRGPGEARTRALLERLRRRVPGLSLRTTFITGFPGETERDFGKALSLVQSGIFEHVVVFPYSDEPRAASHRLVHKVPAPVARARARRLEAAQTRVVLARNRARVGKTFAGLVEMPAGGGGTARAPWQAPEVDGQIHLSGWPKVSGFTKIRMTGLKGAELRGFIP